MRSARAAALVSLLSATLAHGGGAHADGALLVVPVEGGTWASQIAFLQTVPRAPGVAFHVRVIEDDTHRALPCGRYEIALDPDGARALRIGRCDPATGATEIVLVDRAALFAPGDPVPRPRSVAVGAIALRQGGAAGGVAPVGGIDVRCSAMVRPWVADLLSGEAVYLSPEHYRIEPIDPALRAETRGGVWVVSASQSAGTADAAFRVIDLRDGREMVRGRVSLRCAASSRPPAPLTARATSSTGTESSPFRLPAGAVGRGSTVGAPAMRLSCVNTAAPTVVWRYIAPADGTFEFLVQGGFDTVVEVRARGNGGEPRPLGCNNDDGGRANHSRVVVRLSRGEAYDIAVSGAAGAVGRYEVAVLQIPPDVELRPTPEGNLDAVYIDPEDP